MAITDVAAFTGAAQTFYKKRAQDFLRKRCYFNKLGTQERIDKNGGQILSAWRIDNESAQTTALTEGTAPSELALATTLFTATILQYGAFAKISDLVEVTGRSSTMDRASEQLGYNAALTLDTLARNELRDGATALYANNTASGTITNADVFTTKELRRIFRKFTSNDVNPGEDDLFNCVVHPNQAYDIFTDDKVGSWVDINKRVAGDNLWKNELGRMAGFRVLYSSQIDTSSVNGITAYNAIACGPNAFMNVDLEGMPFRLFVNPSANITMGNELGQVGSVGWKASYVAKYIGTDGPRAYKVVSAVSET